MFGKCGPPPTWRTKSSGQVQSRAFHMKRVFLIALTVLPAAMAQSRSRTTDYALILQDEPVARVARSRAAFDGPAAKAQLAKVRAAQEGVRAELQRRKLPVQWAGQLLVNAIVVSAT